MLDQWDDKTRQSVIAVAELLKMKPEDICNFAVVALDHSDSHNPVTLSTVPPEKLSSFFSNMAMVTDRSISILDIQH